MDRNYWDSLADCYEEDLLEIAREDRAGALGEELAALGGAGISVADLGCGPGSLLPLLTRHFGKVIAVDYAPQLLKRARQQNRTHRKLLSQLLAATSELRSPANRRVQMVVL